MTVLASVDNPLKIGKLDMDHISWIASLLSLGGLFGNIIFGVITNRFGRKMPLLFATTLIIIDNLLILFAHHVYFLYVGELYVYNV